MQKVNDTVNVRVRPCSCRHARNLSKPALPSWHRKSLPMSHNWLPIAIPPPPSLFPPIVHIGDRCPWRWIDKYIRPNFALPSRGCSISTIRLVICYSLISLKQRRLKLLYIYMCRDREGLGRVICDLSAFSGMR